MFMPSTPVRHTHIFSKTFLSKKLVLNFLPNYSRRKTGCCSHNNKRKINKLSVLRLKCSFFFYKKVCVYHGTHACIHKGEILAGQVIFNWLSSWLRSLVLSHLLCT